MIKLETLPNIQNALNYLDITEEYSIVLIMNTLIRGSKNKFLMDTVYRKNYLKIENITLQKVSLRKIFCLLLLSAFKYNERSSNLPIQSV